MTFDPMTCPECGTDDGGHTLACPDVLPLELCNGSTDECPHYYCPDGWHRGDAPNCSCTPDCALEEEPAGLGLDDWPTDPRFDRARRFYDEQHASWVIALPCLIMLVLVAAILIAVIGLIVRPMLG